MGHHGKHLELEDNRHRLEGERRGEESAGNLVHSNHRVEEETDDDSLHDVDYRLEEGDRDDHHSNHREEHHHIHLHDVGVASGSGSDHAEPHLVAVVGVSQSEV